MIVSSLKGKSVVIVGGASKVLKLAIKGFFANGCHSVTFLCNENKNIDFLKQRYNIKIIHANINEISTSQMSKIMSENDYLVIACAKNTKNGILENDIDRYYFKENVEELDNLLRYAKLCNIKKVLIVGSDLVSFNQTFPKLKLAENHSYVNSRLMQENLAYKSNTLKLEVLTLQLPLILGRDFQMTRLFNDIATQIISNKKVYSFKGVGNFCTVEEAAQGIVNSILYGKGGNSYPLITFNIEWKKIIEEAKKYTNNKRKIKKLSRSKLKKILLKYKLADEKLKIKNGMNYLQYHKILLNKKTIDCEKTIKDLHIVKSKDWKKPLHTTIEYVRPKYQKNKKQ